MFNEERKTDRVVPALSPIGSLSETWRILDEMERTLDELRQILDRNEALDYKLTSSKEWCEDSVKATRKSL